MQIRFGSGLSMKHNFTHPTRWRLVDESCQIQSPPTRAIAQTQTQDPRPPTPEKKKEPEWRNLTLDELKSWLAEAKRQQEEQNPEIG